MVQLRSGTVHWQCALDERKAEHAFGQRGAALAAIAHRLCQSLAQCWERGEGKWSPPFEGAALTLDEAFSARDHESALDWALRTQSSLYELMQAYEVSAQARPRGIVQQVRQAIRSAAQHKHLERRFSRDLDMGQAAGTLRVDFLGQHYACYFLNLTHSARGVELNTERALAKLCELQALRRFVQERQQSLGLLDDERPHQFELLAVGDKAQAPQRQAMARITVLADRGEVRTRALPHVDAAAEHVVAMERKAA